MTTVRVNFFKPSGRWHTESDLILRAPVKGAPFTRHFQASLLEALALPGENRYKMAGMTAVCTDDRLETVGGFPVLVTVPVD